MMYVLSSSIVFCGIPCCFGSSLQESDVFRCFDSHNASENYDNKGGLIVMSRTVKISLMFILHFGRPHLNTSHMIHVICAMI